MTNDLEGMTGLKKINSKVKFGNNVSLKVMNIGQKRGMVMQKDRKTYAVILEDVKYAPGLFCNLISITQVLNKNFSLAGTKKYLVISKGSKKIVFDHTV